MEPDPPLRDDLAATGRVIRRLIGLLWDLGLWVLLLVLLFTMVFAVAGLALNVVPGMVGIDIPVDVALVLAVIATPVVGFWLSRRE